MSISTSQLLRTGAVLAMAGGLLALIGGIISPDLSDMRQAVSNPLFIASSALGMLGGLLTVLGFPAIYARFARDGGWLGVVGFLALMSAGIALSFFGSAMSLVVLPWVASLPGAGATPDQGPPPAIFAFFVAFGVVALVGAVAFGASVIRTGAYSRWAGYLLILAGVVNIVTTLGPSLPAVVQNLSGDFFNIAIIWFGYELWQQAYEPGVAEA